MWLILVSRTQRLLPLDYIHDDVIGVDCLPFYVGGIGVSILFDNGYLYAIVSDIKEDIIGWKNKKYKSVKSSYLTEHNPVVKIYKYAIIY